MKNLSVAAAIAAAILANSPALADHHEADEPQQARIPFADSTGIRNWRPDDGDDAILIEGSNRQWYRAEFGRSCLGLNFTETVGFETRGTGHFDRFSVVLTREDRCHVRSLYEIPDPDAGDDADSEAAQDHEHH